MSDFIKLPRSALCKLPSVLHKGIFVAILERADESGCLQVSVRRFADEIGVSYQQLRTALKKMQDTTLINAAPNASPTQPLTQITICEFESCTTSTRSKQRKSNAAPNAVSNATPTIVKPPLESYVDSRFAEAWQKWLDYRKEINNRYKSPKSERIGYDQFIKKSNNDPAQAMEMVNNTIANGYKGLFPDRTNGTARPTTPANVAKERRDRGLSLATAIVSQSENLLNLYNGSGAVTDNRENQE